MELSVSTRHDPARGGRSRPAAGGAFATRLLKTALAAVVALAVVSLPAKAQLFGSRDDGQAAVRLNQVEEQMRTLTGQVEELNFQIRQLQDQIRRMQEDNEYRFQQLEQGGGKRSDARPPSSGDTQGLAGTIDGSQSYGAAPGTLGQIPAEGGSGDAEYAAEGGYQEGGSGGPLDLSALARGIGSVPSGDSGGGDLAPGVSGGGNEMAALSSGSPRAQYDEAYSLILSGNYEAAESGFRAFLDAYPNDPQAANAQFWLGESLYARKQYREAADAFLKSYTDYPDSAKVTDSLLKLGLSLRGIGQTDAACATFSELLTKYPGAPTAIRAEAQAQKQSSGCV
ncbi:tol-pal system protein YbgF [Stappia stellulata]|uniref:tol-pal system protein YbgF n=1 Tax=Stappia stellulata TaxID=71235 RepID=UPI001CD77BD4|nr:tol-pal system protein YbgF [Stappia stellulata]MCA1243944.1 tol-pal system protein YbgF [Stappia stellulata]